MNAKLLFVHAFSPPHAGTGQGVGVIDLPIAREKATGIPFLPGTTLKGVFRDAATPDSDTAVAKELRKHVFGPDPKTDDPSEHAGSVTFTDARLLLMPIRSLRGVFAWATSPLLLRRLARDAEGNADLPQNIPVPSKDDVCFTSEQNSPLKVDSVNQIILEDLPLHPSADNDAKLWAGWIGGKLFPSQSKPDVEARKDFAERFCVISDDAMSFLLETATEITARIRIEDEKKTVAEGQLWYEEALPTETVLVSRVVWASVKADEKTVFNEVRKIAAKTLQFGGKATVGRGLCRAIPAWEEMP